MSTRRERILRADLQVFTFSVHCQSNYPLQKVPGSRDIGLPDGVPDAAYLSTLESELAALWRDFRPELVFYQAGVDLWEGFHAACRTVLPQAELVYDRFHAAAELNEALDETRRAEHRRLRANAPIPTGRRTARSPLSATRHWWLVPAEKLTNERRAILFHLGKLDLCPHSFP